MMGSESSHLNGLEIEEKALETTDFWCHYQATIKDSCRYFSLKSDGSVSVFKGQSALGPLWAVTTPLEKFSNNLMKYRHPCIVRYISSFKQRSTFHLATEYVQPLSIVLGLLTPMQICIGLNNILRALVFLHEQACMSHNNVSTAAIYLTGDGQWKLGGLQYLCSFNELTPAYLKQAKIHRYDNAVDPNEDSYEFTTKVDQYGFAVLVEDVFKGCNDDEVPHLREFKKYCKDTLQHGNPAQRPNLSEILRHSFFNHEFITIYKFLNFLPIKSDEEKGEFFGNILKSLKCYDEETVAKQLSGLLLSRLTMIDQTARKEVIPFILKPKNERLQNGEHVGLFSLNIYKEHVKPRVMQLFGVRDTQIRMLLLTHFSKFVQVFSHEELSQHILPELLLGIKDTDDNLVSSTLICLSELVPILGGHAVIGGKRSKLFTDGRPNSKANTLAMSTSRRPDLNVFLAKKTLEDFHDSGDIYTHIKDSSVFQNNIVLNERPPPLGGESVDEEIKEMTTMVTRDSEEDWSDWENSSRPLPLITQIENNISCKDNTQVKLEDLSKIGPNVFNKERLQNAALEAKKNIVDISELDIKNKRFDPKKSEEIDFFADMAPVIEKPAVVIVPEADATQKVISKLNFVPVEGLDESDDWGESWND